MKGKRMSNKKSKLLNMRDIKFMSEQDKKIYSNLKLFMMAEKEMLEYYNRPSNYKRDLKEWILTLSNSDISINLDLRKFGKWKFDKEMEGIIFESEEVTLVLWFNKSFDIQELVTGKASKNQKIEFSGVQILNRTQKSVEVGEENI